MEGLEQHQASPEHLSLEQAVAVVVMAASHRCQLLEMVALAVAGTEV
jgi:hypothetical protein